MDNGYLKPYDNVPYHDDMPDRVMSPRMGPEEEGYPRDQPHEYSQPRRNYGAEPHHQDSLREDNYYPNSRGKEPRGGNERPGGHIPDIHEQQRGGRDAAFSGGAGGGDPRDDFDI